MSSLWAGNFSGTELLGEQGVDAQKRCDIFGLCAREQKIARPTSTTCFLLLSPFRFWNYVIRPLAALNHSLRHTCKTAWRAEKISAQMFWTKMCIFGGKGGGVVGGIKAFLKFILVLISTDCMPFFKHGVWALPPKSHDAEWWHDTTVVPLASVASRSVTHTLP